MFKCYLKNINTRERHLLSEMPTEVHDDHEFQLIVEIHDEDAIQPVVMIGDLVVAMGAASNNSQNSNLLFASITGGFFDNAYFLNYFGECEVSVTVGEVRKSYLVEVNVTGYKANVAKEMLMFLSDNADDILQTCYSKSQTGFNHKNGDTRDVIKFTALTNAIESIENNFSAFKTNHKYNVKHDLKFHSNKMPVVDDTSTEWLADNMDALEIANSSAYKLKINQKYYEVDIPNSVVKLDTDIKENRVLHQFVLIARRYLSVLRENINSQTQNISPEQEYSEYVKFDQVIKGMINPILMMRLKEIDLMIKRLNRIHLFFQSTIPVRKTSGEMPVQSSYTLRQRHYAEVFNQISVFYKASDADKLNSDFLLGLRNLSQLFELCCLYYFVRYFKQIAIQEEALWVYNDVGWNGELSDKLNVLANHFIFANDHFEYTLNYEKKFYSFSEETMTEQKDNLVRIDQRNNHYEPDFTIKVLNKKTQDYYFVILDAKFSRSYKMRNNKQDRAPSLLQSIYGKYGTNLRTYKDGDLVNLTRYIGVIFGLSKSEQEQRRIRMFSKQHDIDGIAPIYPYAAADFISFTEENGNITKMLNKYITN